MNFISTTIFKQPSFPHLDPSSSSQVLLPLSAWLLEKVEVEKVEMEKVEAEKVEVERVEVEGKRGEGEGEDRGGEEGGE